MGFRDRHADSVGAGVPVSVTKCDSVDFWAESFFVGICRFACIWGSLDSKVGATDCIFIFATVLWAFPTVK